MAAHPRWPPVRSATPLNKADLVRAAFRGLLEAIVLADEPIAVTPTVNRPAKQRRRRRTRDPVAAAPPTVIPGDVPRPGFDHVDEPLPGFEMVPRATLRDMEAAMEKITRGQGPPPGFYNPEDADTSVPLS